MIEFNKKFLKYVPILSPSLVEGSYKIDKDLQYKRIVFTALAALVTFSAAILTLSLTNCTGLGIGLLGAGVLTVLSIPFDKWLTSKESRRRVIKEFIESEHPSDELGKYICNDVSVIKQILQQSGNFNKPVGNSEAGLITYVHSKQIFQLIVDSLRIDVTRKNSKTKISILSEILAVHKEENIRFLFQRLNIKPSLFDLKEQAKFYSVVKTEGVKKLLEDFDFYCVDSNYSQVKNNYLVNKKQLSDLIKNMEEIRKKTKPELRNKKELIYNLGLYFNAWCRIIHEKYYDNHNPPKLKKGRSLHSGVYKSIYVLQRILDMNLQNYNCHFDFDKSNSENDFVDLDRESFYFNTRNKLMRFCTDMQNESLIAMDRRKGKIFTIAINWEENGFVTDLFLDKSVKTVENNTIKEKRTPLFELKKCHTIFRNFLKFVYENEEAEFQTKQGLDKTNLISPLKNIVLDYIGYAHGLIVRQIKKTNGYGSWIGG